ncbi:MAG TPA: sugar phosphate nucleotidyltransferase [Planctomycetota bacterium]|nr:sugar phosphate nucleotidyltransferase [Planctomycetota bacterium]
MPDALKELDVLILAGGQGTRLQSVPGDVPKPLRPIHGRPFLSYLVDQVRGAGARRVILSLGYRPDVFRDFAAKEGVEMSVETAPLGTGGGLRMALPLLRSETLLAMNGDSYAAVDLGLLAALHRRRRARATMLLVDVPDAARYGRVEIEENGEVLRFAEKGEPGPGLVNAGVYVLQRSVVAEIPEGRAVSLERETFPSLIGTRFFGEPGSFAFMDIGTPESYAASSEFFLRTKGP